ncbi:MAG: nucleotidyltransferase domain-containing protein [Planctomycetes bacterium]|nr:nucleotidyltransferase domain-containing protein [Planctomycetota bacterium]
MYLFGSRAAGDAPADSDFDVMVVVPETAESSYERRLRDWGALGGFAHPVDLLIYTEAEWEFLSTKRSSVARQVKDHGIVLYAA